MLEPCHFPYIFVELVDANGDVSLLHWILIVKQAQGRNGTATVRGGDSTLHRWILSVELARGK